MAVVALVVAAVPVLVRSAVLAVRGVVGSVRPAWQLSAARATAVRRVRPSGCGERAEQDDRDDAAGAPTPDLPTVRRSVALAREGVATRGDEQELGVVQTMLHSLPGRPWLTAWMAADGKLAAASW